MNFFKPFLIRLLKRSDYTQILGYIVEAKTDNAVIFNKMPVDSIKEATDNVEWLVTVEWQTLDKNIPKPSLQIL